MVPQIPQTLELYLLSLKKKHSVPGLLAPVATFSLTVVPCNFSDPLGGVGRVGQ